MRFTLYPSSCISRGYTIMLAVIVMLLFVSCAHRGSSTPASQSADWRIFAAPHIQLALPPPYAGGSTKQLEEGNYRFFEQRGEIQRVSDLRRMSVGLLLDTLDARDESGVTSVRVGMISVPTELSLEALSAQGISGLSPGKRLVQLSYPIMDQKPAIRTLIDDETRELRR